MRYLAMLLAAALSIPLSTFAAESQPPTSTPGAQTPADYILLTVVLRHDQSRTFEEIGKHLDSKQFWKQFPPPGIEIESWYVMMGLGHVITLRVPPARLGRLTSQSRRPPGARFGLTFTQPTTIVKLHASGEKRLLNNSSHMGRRGHALALAERPAPRVSGGPRCIHPPGFRRHSLAFEANPIVRRTTREIRNRAI